VDAAAPDVPQVDARTVDTKVALLDSSLDGARAGKVLHRQSDSVLDGIRLPDFDLDVFEHQWSISVYDGPRLQSRRHLCEHGVGMSVMRVSELSIPAAALYAKPRQL
jgi:hypothetical protein